MSQGSSCLVDPVFSVKVKLILPAHVLHAGDMVEFLLEFEPYWLLE